MYEHILIATDGSEVAQKGVDHGLALARALGAKATIVNSAESLMAYIGGDGGLTASAYLDYTEAQKMAAERILGRAGEAAGQAGVTADTLFLQDKLPAEAILEAAEAHGCDLVVLSSHGRRGIQRLLLGSVASEVVARSPVPVLVVR
jgi:nucleotide-binding universal stress UspA family protein